MTPIYDVNYFINKFEAIPEEGWGEDKLVNKCVLYHCGLTNNGYEHTPESKALVTLFGDKLANNRYRSFQYAWEINDGIQEYAELGKTPKERILNKLYQIRDGK